MIVRVVGAFYEGRVIQHAVCDEEEVLACGEPYQPARFFYAGRHLNAAVACAESGAGEITCLACRQALKAVLDG